MKTKQVAKPGRRPLTDSEVDKCTARMPETMGKIPTRGYQSHSRPRVATIQPNSWEPCDEALRVPHDVWDRILAAAKLQGYDCNSTSAFTAYRGHGLADAIQAASSELTTEEERKAAAAVVRMLRKNRGAKIGWRWADE